MRRKVAAKPVRVEPFEIVRVTWEDAISMATEQHESPSLALDSYKPYLRKSIGLYLGIAEKDGRRALMLATEDDRAEDSPNAIGGIFQVPLGMVLSCVPIQRKRSSGR